jgi:2-polyprenyl-6-methoxyphenol hydroxylase-like FAD-dependent oxidoreductase
VLSSAPPQRPIHSVAPFPSRPAFPSPLTHSPSPEQVPEPLRRHFEAAVTCGRIRSLQNSQVTVSPLHAPGAILLGDAFNMRHPLTGAAVWGGRGL